MPIRYQIELAMTVALALYALAFFWTRWYYGWKIHASFALLGFVFDMHATYLMAGQAWGMLSEASTLLQVHFLFSVFAVLMFVIQGSLGVSVKLARPIMKSAHRASHRKFATKVFFPVWALSYLTGLFLAIF